MRLTLTWDVLKYDFDTNSTVMITGLTLTWDVLKCKESYAIPYGIWD